MVLRTLVCPGCGAPLPPDVKRLVVVCPFCGASVTDDGPVVRAADYRRVFARFDAAGDDAPRIAGLPYRVLGRLAEGESSDVFLAERAWPITERVVLRVLRVLEDAPRMDRAHRVLAALAKSTAQGAQQLGRRLPQLVARSTVETVDGHRRPVVVHRFTSGFVHTVTDVLAAYPGGLDPRHAIWMWRRILEQLAFVHASGYAHGAVLPQHLLVHARDHGVMLVGWSSAVALAAASPLEAICPASLAFHPPDLVAGSKVSAAADLTGSARVIAALLGGDPSTGRVPASVPGPLASLVRLHADPGATGRCTSAWDLNGEVGRAAQGAYGPPTYVPFTMPS